MVAMVIGGFEVCMLIGAADISRLPRNMHDE
jgi:hypothetical protein